MNNTQIIGCSASAAGAGKDTFCQLLIELLAKRGVKAKRYGLADRLKLDISGFLLSHCGINIFNCTQEEKNVIRRLLVDFGKIKREQSLGTYWTNIIENEIIKDSPQIAIISDIRYDVYPNDEIWWLKEKMKGILVYISRYDIKINNSRESKFDSFEEKIFLQPPNQDEAENAPRLKMNADYCLEWQSCGKDKINELVPAVESVLNRMINDGKLKI